MNPPDHPLLTPRSRYLGARIRMRINRRFLEFCRTILVHLSMVGLLVMFLSGLTGFTVKHEDWFGATTPRVQESEGRLPAELLAQRDRLRMVELLRRTLHISGAITAFDDLNDRFSIGFKAP